MKSNSISSDNDFSCTDGKIVLDKNNSTVQKEIPIILSHKKQIHMQKKQHLTKQGQNRISRKIQKLVTLSGKPVSDIITEAQGLRRKFGYSREVAIDFMLKKYGVKNENWTV